jgi:acyl-CoA dehydrogenase
METNEFLEPFDRMLADIAAPAAVRAIEAGSSPAPLWSALAASGFLDALVPEQSGGVGLTLAEAGPLLMALGRHAVPVPVGETMLARHLLADAGIEAPAGPIVLVANEGGSRAPVPNGLVADHALVQIEQTLVLADCSDLTVETVGTRRGLAARFAWRDMGKAPRCAAPKAGLRAWSAMLRANLIAGAAERLLDMTVAYANERGQFGKPIGRQQAIQQQLAVMAEHVIAARLAAQSVCAAGLPVDAMLAAFAKETASAAAAPIANTAHAIHGAIGISEEFDLQLLTRRLHEWRLADGGPSYWANTLGQAFLASPSNSIDFIRNALVAP